MPKESSSTFAIGARQFVVQLAQLITVSEPSRALWLTLNTIVLRSPVAGADITTRFAPAVRCASAFCFICKKTGAFKHNVYIVLSPGNISRVFFEHILTSSPFTVIELSPAATSALKRPWALSYLEDVPKLLGLLNHLLQQPQCLPCYRFDDKPTGQYVRNH